MSRLTRKILQNGTSSSTGILLLCVRESIAYAREQHPRPYVDAHHMLGVLLEEVDELKREVFRKRMRPEQMQSELLQIAAVCVRGIEDVTLLLSPKSKVQSPKSKSNAVLDYKVRVVKKPDGTRRWETHV